MDEDEARFKYFTEKIFPQVKDMDQGGIMIFMSCYFEFVRISNFLKLQDASFCLLGDYTKQSNISRARIWFYEGKRKMMLYTERAHFYHRYKIVNNLEGSQSMTTAVLFSKFDINVVATVFVIELCFLMISLQLERIVGTGPAKRKAKSDKKFLFTISLQLCGSSYILGASHDLDRTNSCL